MHLVDLDDVTRQYMQSEVESDVAQGRLYTGKRLTQRRVGDYPPLILAGVLPPSCCAAGGKSSASNM